MGEILTGNEYLEEMFNDSIERLNNTYEIIKSKKGNIPFCMNGIEFTHKCLGILELCYKHNLKEGRKHFYKASLAKEWNYIEFSKGTYDIDFMEVTTYAYESLYNAVLSGSKERAIHMANLFGSYKKLEKNEFLANELLGYGFKYVILDDKEQARKYIQNLESSKTKRGMKQFADGHACAFKGIIDQDATEFNKGLEFMLKNHVTRMKKDGNTLEQYFAYDSIALAMIAKDRGIEIAVEHELLPMSYLEETDIDYSELKLFEE